ncbi:hypothetical protein K1F50_06880 [Muricauda oceani]|uniref:DUF4595 domain-containing protein n=1 Tax=Flagellimonas oceani TaxID=2698672 RepID=A0A6G7J5W6_9FLAO|nr:hypothetical protein [Allomuricauda oceani]MBW8242521.1 hypothetical protein [Allomuricauda oceani]QII46281.1 hypothetical protein GVT53_16865 [Allomuricauda oceani]
MKCTKQMFGLMLVMVVMLSCQSNSQVITDWDAILRGPIQSVEINTYKPDLKDGTIQKGNLVNTSSFTLNGEGGKRIFNQEGKRIGFTNYKKGSTEPAYHIHNEYSKGNLVESFTYKTPLKKVLLGKEQYEYDNKNREVLARYFEPSYCDNNKFWLAQKIIYEYNEHDDMIRKIDTSFVHYDCDDIRIRANVYERHPVYENGLKVEDGTYTYEYDQDGNMIKKVDKNNPPIYYEYYPSGVRKKRYLAPESYRDFNEDGYLIRATAPVMGGFMYTIVYENEDNYGNWTRMVIYRDNEPYLIGERTFTYYE